jgi:hypothetical protein
MISACRRVRPHSGHRSGPISHVQRRRSHVVPLFADPGSALPDAFRDLLIIASRIGSARSASRSSRSSSAGSGSSRIATSAARAGCRPCRCGSAHRGLRRQNAGTPCTRRGSGSRSAPSCARSAGRQSSCRMVRPHPLRNLGSPSPLGRSATRAPGAVPVVARVSQYTTGACHSHPSECVSTAAPAASGTPDTLSTNPAARPTESMEDRPLTVGMSPVLPERHEHTAAFLEDVCHTESSISGFHALSSVARRNRSRE